MKKLIIKKGKKCLTLGVVVTTIVWSVGLLALPVTVGAASSGDLIKITCTGSNASVCTAVYYLGADGKRYVFPNEKTYYTWYANFSTVKSISQTEMESYSIGGNVTYKPGVKMVKIQTDPKVYAVAADGTLRWVKTEAIAASLYGVNWNQFVEDVSDAFFVNYTIGTEIAVASDYSPSSATTAATSINTDKGLSVASGSTLAAALAADTPASGIVVGNAARVPFTKVTFTASSDGDVTIDSMVVERAGTAAQDGAFAGIILIDAADQAQIGTSKTLNSTHDTTFTDDIKVSAGSSRSIIIAGNMASSLASYAGEVPILGIKAITLKGGATLVGTLPIRGNYQNLNGTVTIGTLTVADGANDPSDSTQKIGTNDVVFSSVKLTAGSAEGFTIEQIKWTQDETASDSDVQNLELMVDNASYATVAQASDKEVLFNLTSKPITLAKGKLVTIDIRGDIADGSARKINFDIKKNTDIVARGTTYGYNVTPTYPNSAEPYYSTGATITISRGTLKVTPTAGVANANVSEDTQGVVLGKFDFVVKGEDVTVSKIGIQVNIDVVTSEGGATTTDVTNITLYDETGNAVAGPLDPTYKYEADATNSDQPTGVATSTNSFTMVPGTHAYTVKGDLSANFATNDTVSVSITPYPNIEAKGVTTGESLTTTEITPATVQTSAIYTVKTAALAVSVSSLPTAQTVVAGTKDYTFANLVIDAADSGEDVKVTQVKAEMDTTTASPSDFSNWKLFDGTTELAVSNDPDPTSSTGSASATSTFTLVNPLIITKGTSKTLTFKASIAANASSGDIKVGMSTIDGGLSATGKDSGASASVTLSASAGQLMTLSASGTLTITMTSDSPAAGLLPGDTNGLTVGKFRFTAERENVNIEKLYLTATSTLFRTIDKVDSAFDQINAVYLYDGSTLVATLNPTSTEASGARTVLVDITNAPLVIPKDGSKDITVKVDTAGVRRDTTAKGTPGQGFQFSIAIDLDVTAKGAQSGVELGAAGITVSNATLYAMTVYKTVPTVTTNDQMGTSGVASASGVLTGNLAARDAYKFQVSADSKGDVGLFQVSFLITTTTATITKAYLHDGSTYVGATTTANITISDNSSGSSDQIYTVRFTNDGATPATDGTNVVPYVVPAGTTKTFTLKLDVTCGTISTDCSGTSGNGALSIQLLGDSSFPGCYKQETGTTTISYPTSIAILDGYGAYEASFVWTDFDLSGALGTASTTKYTSEQWTNAFRVSSGSGKLTSTSTSVSLSH